LPTLKLGNPTTLNACDRLVVLGACSDWLHFRRLGQLSWAINPTKPFRLLTLSDAHHLTDGRETRAVNENPVKRLDLGLSILSGELGHRVLGIDSSKVFVLDTCKGR